MNYSVVEVSDTTKQVFYNNELIGELHLSSTSNGWFVRPIHKDYQGFFRNPNQAAVELVFKFCEETNKFITC